MTPAKMAERLLKSRRLRNVMFCQHREGLGEPAWDMLLSLFVADSAGRSSVPAYELMAATATDDEIARPYTLWLASQGLVEIAHDRAKFTTAGRALMVAYLDQELAA
jgi:hypothetical protein